MSRAHQWQAAPCESRQLGPVSREQLVERLSVAGPGHARAVGRLSHHRRKYAPQRARRESPCQTWLEPAAILLQVWSATGLCVFIAAVVSLV